MRLFPPPLEIGETEGFTPEKDIFGRAKYGQGLTNLVSSVDDPLVIAVDGQWGSGKSTFLKMWAGELRKAHFPVVLFDAYAHDYNSDAFLAIAGEIISLLQEKEKASTPRSKAFIDKATGVGKVLLRAGIRGGVKAATLGGLDIEDVEDVIADEASKVADQLIGKRLTQQKEEKDTLQAFRDALAELPQHLQKGNDKDTKPLVFIIDELDRCRPLFALDLLEKIKHFFSVPNVHFVMGVNLEQLRDSVRMAYGANINAHAYLEKFIQLTVTFDADEKQPSDRPSFNYINYLLRSMDFSSEQMRTAEYACEHIERIATAKGLSLRSIEKAISNLAIALAFSSKNTLLIPPILAGLCVLKVTNPAIYRGAKKGTLTWENISQELMLVNLSEGAHENVWWRFCLDRNAPTELKEKCFKYVNFNYEEERFKICARVANTIIDYYGK